MKFFTIPMEQKFYLRGVICTRTSQLAFTSSDEPTLGEVHYDPQRDKDADLLTVEEYQAKTAKPAEAKRKAIQSNQEKIKTEKSKQTKQNKAKSVTPAPKTKASQKR